MHSNKTFNTMLNDFTANFETFILFVYSLVFYYIYRVLYYRNILCRTYNPNTEPNFEMFLKFDKKYTVSSSLPDESILI